MEKKIEYYQNRQFCKAIKCETQINLEICENEASDVKQDYLGGKSVRERLVENTKNWCKENCKAWLFHEYLQDQGFTILKVNSDLIEEIASKKENNRKQHATSDDTTWINRKEVRDLELFLSSLVEQSDSTIPLVESMELNRINIKEMDKITDLHETLVKRFQKDSKMQKINKDIESLNAIIKESDKPSEDFQKLFDISYDYTYNGLTITGNIMKKYNCNKATVEKAIRLPAYQWRRLSGDNSLAFSNGTGKTNGVSRVITDYQPGGRYYPKDSTDKCNHDWHQKTKIIGNWNHVFYQCSNCEKILPRLVFERLKSQGFPLEIDRHDTPNEILNKLDQLKVDD